MPPGVIQFVPGPPPEVVAQAIGHPSFAALHFTGSTYIFKKLWKDIAANLDKYKGYPRIVGETGLCPATCYCGSKVDIPAQRWQELPCRSFLCCYYERSSPGYSWRVRISRYHPTSRTTSHSNLCTKRSKVFGTVSALCLLVRVEKWIQGSTHRGNTENQGRRPDQLREFQWSRHVCSKFLPKLSVICADLGFSGRPAFDRITGYIERAKKAGAEVLAGGACENVLQLYTFIVNFRDYLGDDSKGYFIQPTILLSQDPRSATFVEEIFGPVMSVSMKVMCDSISLRRACRSMCLKTPTGIRR